MRGHQTRLVLVVLVIAVFTHVASISASDVDPDTQDAVDAVTAAAGNIGLSTDDRDRYIQVLKDYSDKKLQVYDTIGRLVENDDADISSAWQDACENASSALDAVKSLPLDTLGLQDFVKKESQEFETLKNSTNLLAFKKKAIEIRKNEEDAVKELDADYKSSSETTASKVAAAKSEWDEAKAKKAAVILSLRILNKAYNTHEGLQKFTEEVLTNYDTFVVTVSAWKGKFFLIKEDFVNYAKVGVLALQLERGFDPSALKDQESKAIEESKRDALASRKAYAPLQQRIVIALDRRLTLDKEEYDIFESQNQGRFLGDPSDDVKKSLSGQDLIQQISNDRNSSELDAKPDLSVLKGYIDNMSEGDMKRSLSDMLAKASQLEDSTSNDINQALQDFINDAQKNKLK